MQNLKRYPDVAWCLYHDINAIQRIYDLTTRAKVRFIDYTHHNELIMINSLVITEVSDVIIGLKLDS